MIQRIWTVLNLNLTQMKFYEGIHTNPTQTLLSHLDKSLTDLNVKDLSLYRSDFRLALLSFDLLRNFSSVTGVVYASSLPSLWCVTDSFFIKKERNHLMHCLLAPRATAALNLCASHAG
jgi:hypothetical protein